MIDETDPSTQAPDTGRHEGDPAQVSRRSALKRIGAGLVVAVPALRSLIAPHHAVAEPAHAHCSKTYVKFIRQECVGTRMIAYYEVRCTICYDVCRRFTDDNGPCPQ